MTDLQTCINPDLPAADEYKERWYGVIGREKARGMALSIRLHRAKARLRAELDRAEALAADEVRAEHPLKSPPPAGHVAAKEGSTHAR